MRFAMDLLEQLDYEYWLAYQQEGSIVFCFTCEQFTQLRKDKKGYLSCPKCHTTEDILLLGGNSNGKL